METLGMSCIVWGLRSFWTVVIVLCGIGMLPLGFASEFVRNLSRRGKLKLGTIANNSPKYTVPQSWFTHFYVVGSLVNTILLTIAFLFAYACTFPMQAHESQVSAIVSSLGGAGTIADASGGMDNIVGQLANRRAGRAWGSFVLLAMLETQLLRRLFESFHMFHYSPLARMHFLGYLVGIGYYPAASFTLFSQHFQDRNYLTSLNKFLGQSLGGAGVLHKDPPRLLNSQIRLQDYVQKSFHGLEAFQWVGLAVFLLGWIQQYRSHSILASLRTKKVNRRVEAGLKRSVSVDNERVNRYEIPRGSWFEWVSCAHYLAEIVLYVGIVIVSGGNNLNIWLLFVWVVLNLSVGAMDTHKWYISKFEDYPPFRKAIIPFIF